jgi:hypothetical protein
MISSLLWVPKGASRQRPVRFELSAEEMERVRELAKEEAAIEARADSAEHVASGATFEADRDDDEEVVDMATEEVEGDDESEEDVDTSDLPPELRMDEYDDDDEMADEHDNDQYEVNEVRGSP